LNVVNPYQTDRPGTIFFWDLLQLSGHSILIQFLSY